ncbi:MULTISPECIES: HNH endonuclease signature motif containing protein [unclassified Rathayibacter]|uniref:HNH endonuclease n=1 Tax=unclassified Rathayibacter TaxID=2609250 RepID=UPI001FB419A9|nr:MULTISPECIES: HNH endonuclease signature motif containing protein [unclassified Rathayibacter]MCJ1674647.1 HNH endonuclease [Rathayibacter sp. VKM Ac-2929]MCJ1682756.1 HNH endonuclease [Rathayibacter sp. VKM Ac-2928]
MSEDENAAALAEVRDCFTDAAAAERAASPTRLRAAERIHRGYRVALTVPEAFARGTSRSETRDLVERSIRAELAVTLGVSEPEVCRRLETAEMLMEHLPLTRALLRDGRILWEVGEAICRTASSLPEASRVALDERATDAAVTMTTTQLRRALSRWREELHEQPLAERHARAKEERAVWVTPNVDGMATLCVHAPAPAVTGAYDRLRRIARTLRDDGDPRTLQQLSADAAVDLLCDGDIAGTTPDPEHRPDPTFIPGVRAEVRLTLAASTAVGLDDAPADLDGYGPVPAPIARELIRTAASFTRVLTDSETGAVVSVGRTHRVPPPQMRLHLQLRDQTCRFAGCTRPAATSEADHTLEWRNGGETSLDNLVSLCTSHHHVRHGDQWSYDRVDDQGTLVWTSPTGRRISNRPPPLPGRPPDPPPRPYFVDVPAPF